jgi:hypothetical protein
LRATGFGQSQPSPWFWLTAAVGLVWNAIGAAFYLGQVGVLGGPFAPPPDQSVMPGWVTAAYAVGVWGSVLALIGLLMRRWWSRPLLWIALVALCVDFGWVFFASGAGVQPLGVVVLIIALGLALFGDSASRRGWLRR